MNTNQVDIPRIMFGGNVFGWTLDEKESFRILDILYERGFRFIDAADIYGNEYGLSEKIIGKWMKERNNRAELTLATKGGRVHGVSSQGGKTKFNNNDPEYLKDCLKGSLERLQTDYVDIYYTHFDDEETKIRYVLETHQQFIDSGKSRMAGASNFTTERLSKALTVSKNHNLEGYSILQMEYNLMERKKFETELRPIAQKHKLKIASYFSLASGFLTGKYRKQEDFKGTARQHLTEKYFTEQGQDTLDLLDEISQNHHTVPAAVALQWILSQPGLNSCIVSATKEMHIDAFSQALQLQITAEELNRLNQVSAY